MPRILLALCIAISASAGEKFTKYYRIAKDSPEAIDTSPYVLAVTSSDLERFPKSVVTIAVHTEGLGRTPSAIEPANASKPEKLKGRRHYIKLADNEFGRRGTAKKTHVVFSPLEGTVFVGFIGPEGTTFYYKPISSNSLSLAQRQMPLPGIPGTR